MFDIGFPELMVAAVVALVILGPERLPGALRSMGLMLGRLRRSYTHVKAEIEKEIGMDEIRRQLHNEQIMEDVERMRREVDSIGQELKRPTFLDETPSSETSVGSNSPSEGAPSEGAPSEGAPSEGATSEGAPSGTESEGIQSASDSNGSISAGQSASTAATPAASDAAPTNDVEPSESSAASTKEPT